MLCATADKISPVHGCLFSLLFTTGLRIGALRKLDWGQLRDDNEDANLPVARMVVVAEKVGAHRTVILNTVTRHRI